MLKRKEAALFNKRTAAASRRENGTISYYRDPQTGVIILKAATSYNGRKFSRGKMLPRKIEILAVP